jgi:spore germination protein
MNKEIDVKKDKFGPRTLTTILIITIVEYEVFTFSKAMVAVAKRDAWLDMSNLDEEV